MIGRCTGRTSVFKVLASSSSSSEPDLSVTVNGLHMPNPFVIGSGPPVGVLLSPKLGELDSAGFTYLDREFGLMKSLHRHHQQEHHDTILRKSRRQFCKNPNSSVTDPLLRCGHCKSLAPEDIIRPADMLCGHTASKADLGICYHVVATQDGSGVSSADLEAEPSTTGTLISACTDDVLCIWSRDSGHCRRKRKLPP